MIHIQPNGHYVSFPTIRDVLELQNKMKTSFSDESEYNGFVELLDRHYKWLVQETKKMEQDVEATKNTLKTMMKEL